MKYSLSCLVSLLAAFVLLFTACQKDEIIEDVNILAMETISGHVLDIDSQPVEDARVLLQKRTDSTYFQATSPDSSGFYKFDQVIPGTTDLYLSVSSAYPVIMSGDATPDGDVGEEINGDNDIGVHLDPDENDDGNDFVVARIRPCASRSNGRVVQLIDGVSSPVTGRRMYLVEADANGNSTGILLQEARTDSDGRYSLTSDDGIDAIIVLDTIFEPLCTGCTMYGVDETPETGGVMINFEGFISVDVDSCNTDSDNNFYIEYPTTPPIVTSISGSIVVDLDGDGIGDIPLTSSGNQRIELYNRSTTNVPQTPLINATSEDASGDFSFRDVPAGEYILYFIGDGTYNAISGIDTDQEAGEPASSEAIFIPVNLSTDDSADSLNVYTVERAEMGDCIEQLEVLEYWALCDTSIICQLDRWPIFVVNENLAAIVSPQYQIQWTNLATGASSINDWIYINDFESYKVDVSASDGCEYTLYYTRDCVQDLNGRFYLKQRMGGFAPTEQYADGEVVWSFDATTQTVAIDYDLPNPSSTLIPVGTYTMVYTVENDGYSLAITSLETGGTYDLGVLSHDGTNIFMDDNVAADGILRTFIKRG